MAPSTGPLDLEALGLLKYSASLSRDQRATKDTALSEAFVKVPSLGSDSCGQNHNFQRGLFYAQMGELSKTLKGEKTMDYSTWFSDPEAGEMPGFGLGLGWVWVGLGWGWGRFGLGLGWVFGLGLGLFGLGAGLGWGWGAVCGVWVFGVGLAGGLGWVCGLVGLRSLGLFGVGLGWGLGRV